MGKTITNHFACPPATLVLDDDRKACAFGLRGARFFLETLQKYYLAGSRPTGRLDVALLPISGWGPKTGPGHMDPREAAQALVHRAVDLAELLVGFMTAFVPEDATDEEMAAELE